MVPCAIRAPEISAVEAQPPKPTASTATSTPPMAMCLRIETSELEDGLPSFR